MLFIVLLFLSVVHANWLGEWAAKKAGDTAASALGFPTTDACGFTREDALVCIKQYIDRNGNGEISEEEFRYAKQHYVPERLKRLEWAVSKLGWDYTLQKILPACDANKDGKLTVSDWMASKDTCLPGKADLCKIQYVCQIASGKKK